MVSNTDKMVVHTSHRSVAERLEFRTLNTRIKGSRPVCSVSS